MEENNKRHQRYSRSNRRLTREKEAGWNDKKKYVKPEAIAKEELKQNVSSVSGYNSEYRFDREGHRENVEKAKKNTSDKATSSRSNQAEIQRIEDEIAEQERTNRYSRRDNDHYYDIADESNSAYYFFFLILSALVSLSYYSFPFIGRMPSGTAASNFYSGFAMNHGMTPYLDMYGNAGPLFYLLNRFGTLADSTVILWILEILFVWASGILIFKILLGMIRNKRLIAVGTSFLIFSIGGMASGGNQPIVFALPFALYGFLVLNRYFIDDEAAKDEVFFLFGVSGAFATLFFPFFIVLWIFGAFGLLGKNIALKHFDRGIYQILSTLFGAALVYSFVGYYTLTTQIFYPTIEQAVILPFSNLNFSYSGLLNFGLSFVLVLISGLFSNFIFGFRHIKNGKNKIWSMTLIILAVFSLIFTSFMNGASSANSLVVLPFIFMFISLSVVEELNEEDEFSYGVIFGLFLRKMLYFPIFAFVIMLAFSFGTQTIQKERLAPEQKAVAYLEEKSKTTDSVVVISESSEINYLSGRYSTVSFPPLHYPISYAQSFDVNLASSKSEFVVVDERLDLAESTQGVLSKKYEKVDDFINTRYTIYELKSGK